MPLFIAANHLSTMGFGYGGYVGTNYARIIQFFTSAEAFALRPVFVTAWLLSLIAGTTSAAFYRVLPVTLRESGFGPRKDPEK